MPKLFVFIALTQLQPCHEMHQALFKVCTETNTPERSNRALTNKNYKNQTENEFSTVKATEALFRENISTVTMTSDECTFFSFFRSSERRQARFNSYTLKPTNPTCSRKEIFF